MDASPGVRRKRGRDVKPKWGLSVLNVRQPISSLAKSYRRLKAPWKREPRLVLKGISCRDKTSLHFLTEKGVGGWGKKKTERGPTLRFFLNNYQKYFLDSTSASKGSYSQSCSDSKL